MSGNIYFVDYTFLTMSGRTTYQKTFTKYKDVKNFIEDEIGGYVTKLGSDYELSFKGYFNFEPSATEGAKLKSLLGYIPDTNKRI